MNVQVSIFIYIINQSESNLILISYIIPDGSKIQLRKHGNSTKSSRLYRRVVDDLSLKLLDQLVDPDCIVRSCHFGKDILVTLGYDYQFEHFAKIS